MAALLRSGGQAAGLSARRVRTALVRFSGRRPRRMGRRLITYGWARYTPFPTVPFAGRDHPDRRAEAGLL
jgi:hypothetical protein